MILTFWRSKAAALDCQPPWMVVAAALSVWVDNDIATSAFADVAPAINDFTAPSEAPNVYADVTAAENDWDDSETPLPFCAS
jgi:hypothetical protein